MSVADDIGQDVLHEFVVDAVQRAAMIGQGLLEMCAFIRRDGLPDGAAADVLLVVEDVVQHAVRLGTQCVPVVGIQAVAGRILGRVAGIRRKSGSGRRLRRKVHDGEGKRTVRQAARIATERRR